jgi:hypothetical protein
MTTSSVPQAYSTTSNSLDTITISGLDSIDLSSFTTIDTSSIGTSSIGTSYPSYTYTNGTMGSISISPTISTLTTGQLNTITSINTSDFKINFPEEWVNCFPDFDRIEKMCKEYPGLAIAFEKFKTTYKLVKDHYDTPENQRPRP